MGMEHEHDTAGEPPRTAFNPSDHRIPVLHRRWKSAFLERRAHAIPFARRHAPVEDQRFRSAADAAVQCANDDIVGGGNSGCDIVVEAAQFAERAWHSTRRAYWYMPKYLFGRPADQVGDLMLTLRIPLWLRRASATVLHRLLVGSSRRTGLPKPDHRLFETHPIVNSLLPYYVGQGDITPVPDVARFEGRTAHFTDGQSAEVDIVVFATGYVIAFPFIEPRHLNWRNGRPELYLNVFHPVYDTLFAAGLIQPDSGQFGLVHWQTVGSARYARAALAGHPVAAPLRQRKAEPQEGVGGRVRYKNSPRHYLEVEHWSYQRKLMRWAGRLQ